MLELCSGGSVVGSDSTLSSTEHGDGSVLVFDEREAVCTNGCSVNTISDVRDRAGGSCWRCTVVAAFDVERIHRGRCVVHVEPSRSEVDASNVAG